MIENICNGLGLNEVEIVAKTAKKFCLQLETGGNLKKMRQSKEAISSALVFVSCTQTGVGNTLKKIMEVSGCQKRDISRSYTKIKKFLKIELSNKNKESDLISKFCGDLALPAYAKTIAQDSLEKAKNGYPDISGKTPATIAGAVIWLVVSNLLENKNEKNELITLKNIADVSSLTEGTIKNCYRSLENHLDELVSDDLLKQYAPHLLSKKQEKLKTIKKF